MERPCNLSQGRNHVTFINRKGNYSINTQIVAGLYWRIYNILLSAPGSFHEAAVWQMSQVKAYLSTLNLRHYVLGDAAYPISDNCLTENEAQPNFSKAFHNFRHSGARMEQSECVYSMFKRRFPIVKQMRLELQNAIKVTTAAAVLHNIALDSKFVNFPFHIKLCTYRD